MITVDFSGKRMNAPGGFSHQATEYRQINAASQ